jgi:hypothetical protein
LRHIYYTIMKKIRLTITAIFCCTFIFQTFADPVTKSQAQAIASLFVQSLDNTSLISSSVKTNAPKRVAGNDTLAPYYVFSRGVDKGFIIVSGDDCSASIIGYTESGDFDSNNLPQAMKDMLNGWSELINKAQAAGAKPRQTATVAKGLMRISSTRQNVEPLTKTLWSQGSPYNDLCPTITSNGQQALTGCVATAAAQIIYYFKKDNPDTLLYDTPTYGYGDAPVTTSLPKGTKIDYANMLLSGSGTATQDNAVATLMFAIGSSSWLTYGSSTSGQISKAGEAMNSQFHLSSTCIYKSGYTQTTWEQTIYNTLIEGKPILYSGVHPQNGGHAVVLDGYQASTNLFHFNFGWGNNSYNGYFTVDDSTGMNGFYGQQGMCYNITPWYQNISGKISEIKSFYQKCSNTINVSITNNSTIPYSGIYLYCTTGNSLPSTASANDLTTVIASGENGNITFTYKPTLVKTYHIYLCDSKQNILDSCSVTSTPTVAALHLNKIGIEAGQIDQTIDEITFHTVNNTTANIKVNLTNGQGGSFCQPSIKCELYKYDTGTKEWETTTSVTKTISSITFNENETKDTTFTFVFLTGGTYYKAIMNHTATAGQKSDISFDTADSVVYFTVKNSDLVINEDHHKAVVTGTWDATAFKKLATNANICSYDMTAVKDLTSQPEAPNPNALFYTPNNINDTYNVISNGICDSLIITKKYNFIPMQAFKATKARFNISDAQVGLWADLIIPFAIESHYGTQICKIYGFKSALAKFENVNEIPAMTPVLYMIDHISRNYLSAENVAISIDTIAKAVNDSVIGYTYSTTIPDTYMSMGYSTTLYPSYQSINRGAVINPFCTAITAIIYDINAVRSISIDRQYSMLADSISKAKDIYDSIFYNDSDVRNVFADSIKVSEDAFTLRSLTTASEISHQYKNLSIAIKNYINGTTTRITLISNEDDNAPIEYYTTTGIRINEPQKGINIIRQGYKIKKVIIK